MYLLNIRILTGIILCATCISVTQGQELSGIKTIGGATPDYTDFAGAVADLNVKGVATGGVVFNIRPGVYSNQQCSFTTTDPSSAETVVFQAESGPGTVIIEDPTSSGSNWVVQINNTDNITFKDLDFRQQLSSGTPGRIFYIQGVVDTLRFENCVITGKDTTSNSSNYALLYSPSGNELNYLVVKDCEFHNGSYGVYARGNTGTQLNGDTIINCSFQNQSAAGLWMMYKDDIYIKNNDIDARNDVNTGQRGIFMGFCDGACEISYNQIMLNGLNSQVGMDLQTCVGTSGNEIQVFNNFVHLSAIAGTVHDGIRTRSNSDYINILFNNTNVRTSNTSSKSIVVSDGSVTSGSIDVINNVCVNTAGGYAIYVENDAVNPIGTCNYNDFYVTGSNIGHWRSLDCAALSNWQSASGHDANTFNTDPGFTDPATGDLHITNSLLSGAGTVIAGISDDIDNESRPVNPAIGADEINPAPVELVFFRGRSQNGQVLLEWQTASEVNNSHFELQKKQEDNTFRLVAIVNGAGNSASLVNYSYPDKDDFNGAAYYRLKQVDFDGSYCYSDIIYINPEIINDLKISQKPTANSLNFCITGAEDASINVYIIDELGRERYSTKYGIIQGQNRFSINTSFLPGGFYILRIASTDNISSITNKFYKQ